MAGGNIEGDLTVRLRVAGSAVDAVEIVSTRNTRLGGLLAGRPVAEALTLVPLLFSLCGRAQGVAATRAVEQATGTVAGRAAEAARDILVAGEMLESHIWQAVIDWPKLIGVAPMPAALVAVRGAVGALRPALAGTWPQPGGVVQPDNTALTSAVGRLDAAVRALFPGLDAAIGDPAALETWSRASDLPAAGLMRRILEREWADVGRSDTVPLPDLPAAWFGERLATHDGFAAAPAIEGPRRAETGPWARRHADPLVAALAARHGNGLLTRFAARLVEVAALPDRIRTLARTVATDPSTEPAEATAPVRCASEGAGTGLADTARGRLAHWLSIADGRVRDWRTVAPNEWNFHTDGPLVRGLAAATVDAGVDDDLTERTAWLVAALDPCVPCRIERAVQKSLTPGAP